MPEPDYVWLPKTTLLTFEELTRVTRLFAGLGVRHVRLTGGEPLLRAQVADLTARLAAIGTLDDLAMTTNGVLLAAQATRLREAGLRRITVSLDTLQRARFEALTRRDHLERGARRHRGRPHRVRHDQARHRADARRQ